jgi:hypothetical protein
MKIHKRDLPKSQKNHAGCASLRTSHAKAAALAWVRIRTGSRRPNRSIKQGDHTGPAGLMAGADSGPMVAVEIFVKRYIVPPARVGLELFRAPYIGRRPRLSRRHSLASRSAISLATSNRFIRCPEPVGHSILKLSHGRKLLFPQAAPLLLSPPGQGKKIEKGSHPFGSAQGKLLYRVLTPFDEPFLAANLFFGTS